MTSGMLAVPHELFPVQLPSAHTFPLKPEHALDPTQQDPDDSLHASAHVFEELLAKKPPSHSMKPAVHVEGV